MNHWCSLDFGRGGDFASVSPVLGPGDRVAIPSEQAWATVEGTERWVDECGQAHTLAVLNVDDRGRFKIRASLCALMLGDVGPDDEVELRLTSPVRFFSKKDDGPNRP